MCSVSVQEMTTAYSNEDRPKFFNLLKSLGAIGFLGYMDADEGGNSGCSVSRS